jgi:ligand-binding SRPBCC domain-containing protein
VNGVTRRQQNKKRIAPHAIQFKRGKDPSMWHKTIQFELSPNTQGSRMETVQFLPERRENIFHFFSNAFGLQELTPSWLDFRVLSAEPFQIRQGTLIDYRLSLHGFGIRWQSRIEVWEPPYRFVDVQTRGPYRHWRHEHVFENASGGTICRDIVNFAAPGGRIIERVFIRPDLVRIFEFRQRRLRELFPHPAALPGANLAGGRHGTHPSLVN